MNEELNKILNYLSPVIDGLDLVVVTGPPGSGKSGLIQILANALAVQHYIRGRPEPPSHHYCYCDGDAFGYWSDGQWLIDIDSLVDCVRTIRKARIKAVVGLIADNLDDVFFHIRRVGLSSATVFIDRPVEFLSAVYRARLTESESEWIDEWLQQPVRVLHDRLSGLKRRVARQSQLCYVTPLGSVRFPSENGRSLYFDTVFTFEHGVLRVVRYLKVIQRFVTRSGELESGERLFGALNLVTLATIDPDIGSPKSERYEIFTPTSQAISVGWRSSENPQVTIHLPDRLE